MNLNNHDLGVPMLVFMMVERNSISAYYTSFLILSDPSHLATIGCVDRGYAEL